MKAMIQDKENNDESSACGNQQQSISVEEETKFLLSSPGQDNDDRLTCGTHTCNQPREKRSKSFLLAICVLLLGIIIPISSVLFGKADVFSRPKGNPSNQDKEFNGSLTNIADAADEEKSNEDVSNYTLLIANYPKHKQIQIENYKAGLSLIVNFHITHHAGTTLCQWARANGPVPSFACMKGNNTPPDLRPLLAFRAAPWPHDETDDHIRRIRPVFHYVSWEYEMNVLPRSVNATNWEHPHLVSIIVMRNPIDRLLSDVGRHYVKNDSVEEWWDYANHLNTDNYALRTIMSIEGCCQGAETSESYVEAAKAYIQRFTFIIDMDCLEESVRALSDVLGLRFILNHGRVHEGSARERIHNDTVYNYLLQRNAKDMELYEWSKQFSLLKCKAMN